MTALHDIDGAPVIVGGGLAGLMTALALAPQPVVLLTRAPLGFEASSVLAQGGIAACVGADDDASLHLADTLAAGAGLCDEAIAGAITAAAPVAIERLAQLGVAFDRDTSAKSFSVSKRRIRVAVSFMPAATPPAGTSFVR
jgi:L-aspartate oxidase